MAYSTKKKQEVAVKVTRNISEKGVINMLIIKYRLHTCARIITTPFKRATFVAIDSFAFSLFSSNYHTVKKHMKTQRKRRTMRTSFYVYLGKSNPTITAINTITMIMENTMSWDEW